MAICEVTLNLTFDDLERSKQPFLGQRMPKFASTDEMHVDRAYVCIMNIQEVVYGTTNDDLDLG